MSAPEPPVTVELDPLVLLARASGPVLFVNWTLIAASCAVWVVAVLKLRQLARLGAAERRLEAEGAQIRTASELVEIARRHPDAPGARVVQSLLRHPGEPDLAEAGARRAIVAEEQRAGSLLSVLATVGAAAPFVGLFGTVWGILDAFLRIGREKSASLPVVAPAIGEALISTAMGLFAAIPAVVFFNVADKRQSDLLASLEAAAGGWISLFRQGSGPGVVGRRAPIDSAGAGGDSPWAQGSLAPAAAGAADSRTSTSHPSST